MMRFFGDFAGHYNNRCCRRDGKMAPNWQLAIGASGGSLATPSNGNASRSRPPSGIMHIRIHIDDNRQLACQMHSHQQVLKKKRNEIKKKYK